jgi:hypothetical protein
MRIRGMGDETWRAQNKKRAAKKLTSLHARKKFLKDNLPNMGNKFAKEWIAEIDKEIKYAQQCYLRALTNCEETCT